jgi:uncharacterized phiE125 gp8 family phage protein
MIRDQQAYMRLELVAPPVVEPLTAAEAKARLAIGDEVSDEVMNAWIMAARQQLDGAVGWLNRALITQSWRGHLDAFPCGNRVYIPLPPLQQLTISYIGADGSSVALTEDVDYKLTKNAQRPYITPIGSWPSATISSDAITLDFIAGYGDDGASVPEPIRTAIVLGVSYFRTMSARNLMVTLEREEGIGETRYGVSLADLGTTVSDAVQSLLSVYRVIEV